MPIEFGPGDRDYLKKLTRGGPPKPTRQQTAIALLGLAEGLTAAEVAGRAGISVAVAESIAAAFAEGGLDALGMDAGPPKVLVHLIRPGFSSRKFKVPTGSTVAELLDRARAEVGSQIVFLNGEPAELSTELPPGAKVTLVPRVRNSAGNSATNPPRTRESTGREPWRVTIPAFRDDELYQEFLDVVNARRQADLAAEDDAG